MIHINPVKYNAEDDVGYIRITTFNEQTTANLQKAIEDLKKEIGPKLKGYIIDLRNNPGGLLDQAISVSDAFLDQGAIVLTKGRNLEETQRSNARPGDITDGAEARGADQWRLGVGLGDRRRRAAGSPPGDHRRHPLLRQGLGADHHPARLATARSGSPPRATTRRRAARSRPRASSPRWWSRRSFPTT